MLLPTRRLESISGFVYQIPNGFRIPGTDGGGRTAWVFLIQRNVGADRLGRVGPGGRYGGQIGALEVPDKLMCVWCCRTARRGIRTGWPCGRSASAARRSRGDGSSSVTSSSRRSESGYPRPRVGDRAPSVALAFSVLPVSLI